MSTTTLSHGCIEKSIHIGYTFCVEVNPTRIKELRTGRGLSIRKLAEEAGVSTETIYSLEHGRREFIWPRTAKKLADALGVEPKDLFG